MMQPIRAEVKKVIWHRLLESVYLSSEDDIMHCCNVGSMRHLSKCL